LIKDGLAHNLGNDLNIVEDPENPDHPVLRYTVGQTVRAKKDGVEPVKNKRRVGVPSWARTSPPEIPQKMDRFRPSIDGRLEDQNQNPKPVSDVSSSSASTTPANDNDKTSDQGIKNTLRHSPLSDRFEMSVHQVMGNVVHELLEYLPNISKDKRQNAAILYLKKEKWALSKLQQDEILTNVMTVLNDKKLSYIFGKNARPEISVTGVIEQDGKKQILSGQIDRLVVEDDTVWIVDYKNGRNIPKSTKDISRQYLIQMATYRHALRAMYPNKKVKCALLWTRTAKLQIVTDKILDKTCQDIKLGAQKKGSISVAKSKKNAP
jgi:ATP-dependent helicase/nuclease subunit A